MDCTYRFSWLLFQFQQDANPLVCLAAVEQDSFNGLLALVQYYQMVSWWLFLFTKNDMKVSQQNF